ncbi:MAG TPA: hypothetical protein VGE50_07455 [Gammaproteobacteria bacterium]
MKTNLKQKYLRNLVCGAAGMMLLSASNAFAFPTSGTCAMLVTKPVPAGALTPYNNTYNILATLTFTGATSGTVHFNAMGVTYDTTGPAVSVADSQTSTAAGLSFVITDGPIPGSKLLDGGNLKMNLYAVNGGKTILVQGASDLFSGVCQF